MWVQWLILATTLAASSLIPDTVPSSHLALHGAGRPGRLTADGELFGTVLGGNVSGNGVSSKASVTMATATRRSRRGELGGAARQVDESAVSHMRGHMTSGIRVFKRRSRDIKVVLDTHLVLRDMINERFGARRSG